VVSINDLDASRAAPPANLHAVSQWSCTKWQRPPRNWTKLSEVPAWASEGALQLLVAVAELAMATVAMCSNFAPGPRWRYQQGCPQLGMKRRAWAIIRLVLNPCSQPSAHS